VQPTGAMAKRLEDLPIFTKASEFCEAVTATLAESQVRRNRKLYDQIDDANDSVMANLQEGFEQGTDAQFASYLFHSKGSVGEISARFKRAKAKNLVSQLQQEHIENLADELRRMLGGFIRYLRECDWKDRGRHSAGDDGE
jgi:four helix bundle protein